MPELPEVELLKRQLQPLIGMTVNKVIIRAPKMVSPRTIASKLQARRIVAVKRLGKVLVFALSGDHHILIHLKMTGQLVLDIAGKKLKVGGHPIRAVTEIPNKYTHIILDCHNAVLYFNDVRRFGYMKLIPASQLLAFSKKFGIDPLTSQFTLRAFQDLLRRKPHWALKKFLLDQSLLSGLGNIYSDEACFEARILPMRIVSSLTTSEILALHMAIPKILRNSLYHKGTSDHTYRTTKLPPKPVLSICKAYGRGGKLCLRCKKRKIIKIKRSGRGTVFCKNCQF